MDQSLKEDQAAIDLLAFPLTPYDVSMVERGGPSAGVGGGEGLAVVRARSPTLRTMKEGDVVLVCRGQVGTWRDHVLVDRANASLVPVPVALREALRSPGMLERAATLMGAPSIAYRLLEDFGLKKGDVLIQNGGGTAVGLAMVQLAAARGIKTLSVVDELKSEPWRSDGASADPYGVTAERIKALGGDIVISSAFSRRTAQVQQMLIELSATKDGALPRLAFNGVGGESATALIKSLRAGGTFVTYSGWKGSMPIVVPSSSFVDKDLTMCGFNMAQWLSEASQDSIRTMVNDLASMMVKESLTGWIERKDMSDVEPSVFASARHVVRARQVVVVTKTGEQYLSA